MGDRNKHYADAAVGEWHHESPYPPLAGRPRGGIWARGRVLVAGAENKFVFHKSCVYQFT